MMKYIKFVIGMVLIIIGLNSITLLFTDTLEKTGRRIVENGVDTVGTIEKRTKHSVAAKWGRVGGIGSYYTMTYQFRTEEGKLYGGSLNISEEQAYAAVDGQQIKIRYMQGQPTINSPTEYREYMTAEQAQDVPVVTFIFAGLLFFAGGAWLTWSSWRQIRPAARPNPVTLSAAVGRTAGRTNAVGIRGSKQLFGK